jgi:hypothetical protein
MSKVNSHSITALGAANKLEADTNKKDIAKLEKENTKRKDDISDLKS